MPSRPTGLIHLVERLGHLARERPDDAAVIDGQRTLSYGAVHGAALGAALRLRKAGVGRGDVAGLLLRDSALFLVLVYGLMHLGAIVHPMDPLLAAADREDMLRRFGIKAIICGRDAAAIGSTSMIRVDESWLAPADDRDSIDGIARDPALACELAASSGTTGKPKGFLVDHQMQGRRFESFAEIGIGSGDRYLSIIGLQFNMGLRCALGAVDLGGAVIVNQSFASAAHLAAACAKWGVTWTYMVPYHLRKLLAREESGTPLLPDLRRLLVAGSKLWDRERQAARERVTPHVYEIYGANEVGCVTLAAPDDQVARPESVGRTMPGFELQVVGPEGTPLPPGAVGVIRFRGPGMANGYFRNPEASALQFRAGWFHPGDLGSVDGDGFVVVMGRADDVINVGGIKFHAADVEAALLGHPAVAEAAVVGWTTARMQEVSVGFVVRRGDTDERQLIEHCRRQLARYKVPARIVFVPELPKTGTGKVQRQELRARLPA